MLTTRAIADRDEWNRTVLALADPHVLQSWEWGAFKARQGWTVQRILLLDRGAPRAAAQILRRPLPRTPLGVLYVPRGPLLAEPDPSLFDLTLEALEQNAREQAGMFVKIDPEFKRPDSPDPLTSRLTSRRWRPSKEQIQFKNTVLLDLSPSEEQLLAGMKHKTRYNIRLAGRRGVRVGPGGPADLAAFYDMYAETSARDGFIIRPFAYYQDVWGSLMNAQIAKMFLARLGDEIIAGLILFVFGQRALYFYGASRSAHRDAMPNHLLQWEAIRWAKGCGCAIYDFWGAPDTLDENEPMYGVYRFKEGFGGAFTQNIGAYDFVVNPALYWLYAIARPWYLRLLRSTRGAMQPREGY